MLHFEIFRIASEKSNSKVEIWSFCWEFQLNTNILARVTGSFTTYQNQNERAEKRKRGTVAARVAAGR